MNRPLGKSPALALVLGLVASYGCRSSAPGTPASKPNIVLYIIDGAAAERMSVYGYGRRTTPCLERLAAEGAVFENAYSNSSFTKTSVPSFMTSLHSSVLGATRSVTDPLPTQAITMAERMRQAGYATEVLTSNPYCGRISGLDRGVDVMLDTARGRAKPSSAELVREFWHMREADPREPYWVHFQSTDVHRPWDRGGRLIGIFAAPGSAPDFDGPLDRPLGESNDARLIGTAGDLYDECMAFQDASIGRLADRLRRSGEWDRTLFIVAADHSQVAAGLPLFDPEAPRWDTPILASHKSRVPLIFIWPGRIAPGRRVNEQVSMIDLMPTVLDLVGLPPLKVAQGRSLAPLLLGKRGWKPRPVIFDEFYAHGDHLWGSIEVIDGRWGASLRIDTRPDAERPPRARLRPAPLLIFDIERDPHALKSLHEARPDLVKKYSRMLDTIWKEHQVLATKFSRSGSRSLTPEEAETLRTLGYIR